MQYTTFRDMVLRPSVLSASRLALHGCRNRVLGTHQAAAAAGGICRFALRGGVHKAIAPKEVSSGSFSTSSEGATGEILTSVQGYYDDSNAQNFLNQVRGEDIHVGRYDLLRKDELENLDARERIKRAMTLATSDLLSKVFPAKDDGPLPSGYTVMDMGSANGSTARTAVKEYGCNVVCIDISQGFNTNNAELSAAAGLSDKIIIPGERSFFDTQMPTESMDAIMSQDSFMHVSTEHHRAIEEAARVLKPGGVMAFADLMQTDNADPDKLTKLYRELGVVRLGSPGAFEEWGQAYGFELVEFDEGGASSINVHFRSLVEMIESLRGNFEGVNEKFLNKMTTRYSSWCAAAELDVVTWGTIVLKKKSV